jgi:hypothetical protein
MWGLGERMISDSRVIGLFRKSRFAAEIVPGARFRHISSKVIETAEVLAITADPMGIPHVRFTVVIESRYRSPVETGPRMLNLQSFTERFSDPVHSA